MLAGYLPDMFIKKVTNNKVGVSYLTYRLVKSQRIDGISRHIHILEMGSLSEIPLEKHKALADRIEQLMFEDTLLFSNQNAFIEGWAHFFYKKLIENSFRKPKIVSKDIDNEHYGQLFPDDFVNIQEDDNIAEVKLDTFESRANALKIQ